MIRDGLIIGALIVGCVSFLIGLQWLIIHGVLVPAMLGQHFGPAPH